jgi:hypothetical protein
MAGAMGRAPSQTARRPIRVGLAVALVFLDWRASHGWIGLFSVAPMTSVRVWIDGIVFSIVFGWVTGVVLGLVYNRLIRR